MFLLGKLCEKSGEIFVAHSFFNYQVLRKFVEQEQIEFGWTYVRSEILTNRERSAIMWTKNILEGNAQENEYFFQQDRCVKDADTWAEEYDHQLRDSINQDLYDALDDLRKD